MRIIRTYIIKDFAATFAFSVLSLGMVMFLGNLMKLADMIIRKGVDPLDAFKLFAFFLPYILGFIIPVSCLLAVLLTMGRLIADNELIPINTAGISSMRILNIFLVLGSLMTLALFILNDRYIPDAHYNYRRHMGNVYTKNISALIEPGVFLENFENYVLYVSDKDESHLRNVFIYEVDEKNSVSKVTFAKRADFTADDAAVHMKLEDGFKDESNPKNERELYRLNFKTLFVDMPIQKSTTIINKKPSDMQLGELRSEIKRLLRQKHIDAPQYQTEFHKRISFSASALVFVLLGFGVSLSVKHREKSINFGVAFIAAGLYYIVFIVSESFAEHGSIVPWLAMWLPNILAALTGLFFIYRYARSR